MANLTDNTFHSNKEDSELILAITDRAHRELTEFQGLQSKLHTMMDLTVVNNTVGLRLQELLDAPMLDFSHDIWGIYDNMDRSNYQLTGCFLPRYAR